MPASSQRKKTWKSGLLRSVKEGFSKFRPHSQSPRLPRSQSLAEQTTDSLTLQSADHSPSTSTPIPVSQAASIASVDYTPLVTASPTIEVVSKNNNRRDDAYAAIGGVPTDAVVPKTLIQRAKAEGSVAYEGLKAVAQALYNCSDIFLPVKTAVGVFLEIDNFVDRVSANKNELEKLQSKLEAILSIVEKYKIHGAERALNHRIELFCQAINVQTNAARNLQSHSLVTRTAEGSKDADIILKTIRNINDLCGVFQMDTELHIEDKVEDIDETVKGTNETVTTILQRLNSDSIDRLRHDMTSYNTRHSAYGDPRSCMPGTRVKILADLKQWALGGESRKVYWMVGMAGTGKSTISHTLCEILSTKNMLGASFFCSRASGDARNARIIVPTIAHALASTSPTIKSEIIKVIENNPELAEPTYNSLDNQFRKFIIHPLRASVSKIVRTYKVVVIDAVDECSDLRLVSALIQLILKCAPEIPLKIFIASRDETLIRKAFYQKAHGEQPSTFYLHEVEKDIVKDDIRKYLEISLAAIHEYNLGNDSDPWPSQSELSKLADQCGALFIYAATAVRYIDDGGEHYKSRFSVMANRDSKAGSKLQTSIIDGLYGHILEQACAFKEESEVTPMRDLVSIIIFLRTPLSIQAISSLSGTDALLYLSPLKSVIHLPTHEEAPVAPFHASFPDFVTDPIRCSAERCSSFAVLHTSTGHGMLALKCLEQMNRFLRYGICGTPKGTVSRRDETISLDLTKLPEALKYSCLYWASHLLEAQSSQDDFRIINALHVFLYKHLLHWIECLSVLGELQTGLLSLGNVATVLSRFKKADIRCQLEDLQLLADDARRCLQMNFEAIQKHCFEVYQSALVWLPNKSLFRKVYAADVCRVPKVILGLSNTWSSTELVMENGYLVTSIAFSRDGSRVLSGSFDGMVRIWNAMTGEVEADLTGHTGRVNSVAFSPDSSKVVSGSHDQTVQIWNVTTGEVEAMLIGHIGSVNSVAFSQDALRVASGSDDKTVRVWNSMTGELEAELIGHMIGHTGEVLAVTFSQTGTQVISGSRCETVRIWNLPTGEVEAELKGHTGYLSCVTLSADGSRAVSLSVDTTVWIRNVMTGEVEAELTGHPGPVNSVAFSQDGHRVVSASQDGSVRTWNATTGELEINLTHQKGGLIFIAFSKDGSRIVGVSSVITSTESYASINIWSATTGRIEAELQLKHPVTCISFSPDGSKFVCGLHNDTLQICDVGEGKVETELIGHIATISSVAFSLNGHQVVSGSYDKTARIWNAITGEAEVELAGHRGCVRSVAFSQDGCQVVSGSDDNAVRIWNSKTGTLEAELMGHMKGVGLVAFSLDGRRVISGSHDTVRIWNSVTREVEAESDMLKSLIKSLDGYAFSQDGTRVVYANRSSKPLLRIWNTFTGEVETNLEGSLDLSQVESVALSHDNSRAVSGLRHAIWIWNTTTGKVETVLKGHSRLVGCAALSQDGSRVVSAAGGSMRIWNATQRAVEAELTNYNVANFVAFSQDGHRVVSSSHDGTIQIWNARTGEAEVQLTTHAHSVTPYHCPVTFSPDGSRVICGSYDSSVWIWNAATGEVEMKLEGHTEGVTCAAFSQDGKRAVSGSYDRTVRIWNVTTGEVEVELKGHEGPVLSVAFSLDGCRVVSGSGDRSVWVWSLTTSEVEAKLTGHSGSVGSVAFSEDGRHVVFGLEIWDNAGDSRAVHIWDVQMGHSHLMTTLVTTLPDSSNVYSAGPGKFFITYPAQQSKLGIHTAFSVSHDRQWILGGLRDCWIPLYYRDFLSFSSLGSRVCLGLRSGRMVILDMTATP